MGNKRNGNTIPLVLAASALGAIVAGGVWAWSQLKDATPTANEEYASSIEKRKGPKPVVVLSTSSLPPVWLISRLSDSCDLSLLIPAKAEFPFPDQYKVTQLLPEKLLFHQTAAGAIHLARSLGGTVIYATDSMEGDNLPEDASKEEGEQSDTLRVPHEEFGKSIKSFVAGYVVVGETKSEARSVASWKELASLLKI